MRYSLREAKLDLGTTPIENIFLNNYLALADGDSVKVYLYAYKKAYEGSTKEESFEEIGQKLGLSPESVQDAFGFWQEQGIVDIVSEGESFNCVFKSLRELILGVDTSEKDEPIQKEKEEIPVLSNDSDKSMTNKQMFDQIEEVLGTNLLPNEIQRIHELKKEFNQERRLIVEGFIYSYKTQNKKNVNYVLTVLRNWAIDGILTMEDLAKQNKKKEESKKTNSLKKRPVKKLSKEEKKSSDEINEALKRKLLEDYKKAKGGYSD